VILINFQFDKLKPEKRERIINAALKEFARNGYEKASTNEIIKEAEIAKGKNNGYHGIKEYPSGNIRTSCLLSVYCVCRKFLNLFFE